MRVAGPGLGCMVRHWNDAVLQAPGAALTSVSQGLGLRDQVGCWQPLGVGGASLGCQDRVCNKLGKDRAKGKRATPASWVGEQLRNIISSAQQSLQPVPSDCPHASAAVDAAGACGHVPQALVGVRLPQGTLGCRLAENSPAR